MRKLAMLLTLCLVVTMLPGVGYSEDGPDLGLEVEQPLPQEELLLELPEEEQEDAGLIDGDLLLDLDALSDSLLIVEDPGEITLSSEDGNAQDPAVPSEPSGANPDGAGATPYIDPEGPKLAANTLTLGIEDFFYLDSTMPGGGQSAYTYISSDSAIAKVYKSSRVTGVSEGFACITAVILPAAESDLRRAGGGVRRHIHH